MARVKMKGLLLGAVAFAAGMSCSKPGPASVTAPELSAVEPVPKSKPEQAPETPVAERESVTLKLGEPIELPPFEGAFELQEFVIESVEPDPGDPDDVGGAGIQLKILAASQAVTPYFNAAVDAPKPVAWTDEARIEVVGYDSEAPSVDIFVDRVTEAYEGDERTLSLGKGESGDIGGMTMRFDRHSHKATYPGQRSPLMMSLTYDAAGQMIVGYVSLFPPEEATWRWRNYDFHLVDWDYGKRIDVKVRRRQLEPVNRTP